MMHHQILAAAVFLATVAAELQAAEPDAGPALEDRARVEALIGAYVADIEDALEEVEANQFERRYYLCYSFGVRQSAGWPYNTTAGPNNLFPDIHAQVLNRLMLDKRYLELETAGISQTALLELARAATRTPVDFQNCRRGLLPEPGQIQAYSDQASNCAGFLSEGLTPFDEPDMLRCPYSDLLDPLPGYVDAYQQAISASANELLVGLQLAHGFEVVRASAAGRPSRTPDHCAIASVQIRAENMSGERLPTLHLEIPYAVRQEGPEDWVVNFPDTEGPVGEFCSEHGFELTGGTELSIAQPPRATFSAIVIDELADR